MKDADRKGLPLFAVLCTLAMCLGLLSWLRPAQATAEAGPRRPVRFQLLRDGQPAAHQSVQARGEPAVASTDAAGWVTVEVAAPEFQLLGVRNDGGGWIPSGTVWNASLQQDGTALTAVR